MPMDPAETVVVTVPLAKVFTAVSVLQLNERGMIDGFVAWIIESKERGRITVRTREKLNRPARDNYRAYPTAPYD